MRILTAVQISAAAILPIGVLATQKSDGNIKPNIHSISSEPDTSVGQFDQTKLPITESPVSMAPPENISIARVEKKAILATVPPKLALLPDRIESSWNRIIEASQDSSLNSTIAQSAGENAAASVAPTPEQLLPHSATATEPPVIPTPSVAANSGTLASMSSPDPHLSGATPFSPLTPSSQIEHHVSEPTDMPLVAAIPEIEQLDRSLQIPQQVSADPAPTTPKSDNDYSFGLDEQMQGIFLNEVEQSGDYQVLAESSLHFPTAGNIAISGLTLQQAENMIVRRPDGEFNDHKVTIERLKVDSTQFNGTDTVERPGSNVLLKKDVQAAGVMQAIQAARGAKQAANLRQISIWRSQTKDMPKSLQLNREGLLQAGSSK